MIQLRFTENRNLLKASITVDPPNVPGNPVKKIDFDGTYHLNGELSKELKDAITAGWNLPSGKTVTTARQLGDLMKEAIEATTVELEKLGL